MTARAIFRQEDITRALKGVKAAGIADATVRLRRDGDIVIQIGGAAPTDSGTNEWDEVFNDQETPPS